MNPKPEIRLKFDTDILNLTDKGGLLLSNNIILLML